MRSFRIETVKDNDKYRSKSLRAKLQTRQFERFLEDMIEATLDKAAIQKALTDRVIYGDNPPTKDNTTNDQEAHPQDDQDH